MELDSPMRVNLLPPPNKFDLRRARKTSWSTVDLDRRNGLEMEVIPKRSPPIGMFLIFVIRQGLRLYICGLMNTGHGCS
jgi:hypothetical protein